MSDINKTYVGKIITFTGRTFDIMKPTPSQVSIIDIAHSLGMQCRYNGHIPKFYSVAEHSIHVASILVNSGRKDLALTGLLHDAAEAYIGDMVHPLKRAGEIGRLFIALELELESVVGEKFDVQLNPMPPAVKEADTLAYQWEVENVRPGLAHTLLPHEARDLFIQRFMDYGGTSNG